MVGTVSCSVIISIDSLLCTFLNADTGQLYADKPDSCVLKWEINNYLFMIKAKLVQQ